MSLAKKHVLGFSPNGGKHFAIVDEQGILRIWDTEVNSLKQEYTPNLHLSSPCTALTWVTVASAPSNKPRKSQQQQTVTENHYIALGTDKGKVYLYSLAEGKIERTLKGEGHNGPITSIVYDNAGHLYTVGMDCQLIAWSLAEECCISFWEIGNEKPQSVVYMPKSKSLVIGSKKILVFDIAKQELLETFTGHGVDINAMDSFTTRNGDEYVITASKTERVICFWKVGKKGKNKKSSCTLVMEDLAYNLASEVCNDGQLRIASVTRNGNVHIYLLNEDIISSDKVVKPKVSIQIASDDADTVEPLHAIAAHFVQDANRSHEILVGYGSRRLLQFERVTPNYSEKLNVIVRADPKKLYSKKLRKDEPGTDAALKMQTPIVNHKNVEFNSALPVSKKIIQNDVPMEARLQNLSVTTAQVADRKLQTQSKAQLLMQALHSKDETMLAAVLNTKDKNTIELTLKRLPVEYVAPLVHKLTALMHGKNTNVSCALRWLQILVSTHTTVLMSSKRQELRQKLGICLGIAEQRMQCLTEALQISGRVNLIINQMKQNASVSLNERNVLLLYDDAEEAENVPKDDKDNWSDLEENGRQLAMDDGDLAGDDEDLAMTQDSDADDDYEMQSDQEANADENTETDTDESSGE